jgi:hypothetical protein
LLRLFAGNADYWGFVPGGPSGLGEAI